MSNRSNSPDLSGVEHFVSDDLRVFVPEQTYIVSSSIESVDVSLVDELYRMQQEFASCFEGKETERNWLLREKAISKWRAVIRGNASSFVNDLIDVLTNEAEGICKGIRSLRTTLSNHSCYLVKELAIILKADFDGLNDAFIPTLLKQSAATKNITTTNANHTMCSILMNCAFSHKLLGKIHTTSLDKNAHPRAYSGLWLRIFITRFHSHAGFLSHHGQNALTGVDVTVKIVTKLLKDPNPLVRTSGKDCFWTYCKYFPVQADELLSTLDSNIVKAIGRSKDSAARELPSINSHISKGSQQSMREVIAARRKETRSASPLFSSSSSVKFPTRSLTIPSSNQTSRFESLKLVSAKLGPPRRIPQVSSPIAIQTPPPLPNSTHTEVVVSDLNKLELNKPKILEEHTKVNEILFEKESDPILKFLASSDEELINEGISLLKFAIKGNEDLSDELNDLLTTISFKNAEMLRPLFCDSDVVLERCSRFFHPSDYLRLCCLLIQPLEHGHLDTISKAIEMEELFAGIQYLFNLLVSYIDIENGDLVVQIIAFKSVITESLINMLTALLERFPVTDDQFRGLSTVLIKFQGFISDTDIYPSYSNLIVLLKTINQRILREELEKASSIEKSKIEEILGTTPISSRDMASLSEDITRVNVPRMISDLSPVKITELTKVLIPSVVKHQLMDSAISETPEMLEVENMDVEYHNTTHSIDHLNDMTKNEHDSKLPDGEKPSLITQKYHEADVSLNDSPQGIADPESLVEEYENEFKKTTGSSSDVTNSGNLSPKSDTFSDDEIGFESHPDLVEDFTKVHISPLKAHASGSLSPGKLSPLDNFIERVDPLNKFAKKNKPIPIFEDSEVDIILQKSKQHSFTDLKWYNLQMAKLTFNSFALDEIEKNDLGVERFKGLCEAMITKTINGKQILILLNYMQDANTLPDFNEYFKASGKSQLARSLLKFLELPKELPIAKIQSGLIIIKLLLINRYAIDLDQLWHILLVVSERCKSAYCELAIGLSEVFDEMLLNGYSERALFNCLTTSLMGEEYADFTTVFVLESLSKVVDSDKFKQGFSENLILTLDQALRRYLSHRMVDVRRITIVFYARLIRLAIALHEHGEESALGTMNSILPQLTFTERKLVEYYSS